MSEEWSSPGSDAVRQSDRWDTALAVSAGTAVALAIYGLGRGATPALSAYRALGALLLIFLAVRPRRSHALRIPRPRLLLLAWALPIAFALSLIKSVNRGVSLIALADAVAGVAVFTAVCRVRRRTAARLGALELLLMLPVAASAVLEPFGLRILTDFGTFPGRAVVKMGGPCSLGALLAVGAPLSVSIWLVARRTWSSAFGVSAALLLFAGVTASFSRAALAAALVGSLATFFLVLRSRRNLAGALVLPSVRRRAAFLLIAIALAVIGYNAAARQWAPPEYRIGEEPGTQTLELTRRIEDSELTNAAVRVRCWEAALKTASTDPLLGVGIGCFGHAVGPHIPDELLEISAAHATTYRHAYSDYLEMLAECGPLALALFVVLFAWVLARLLRSLGSRNRVQDVTKLELIVTCGAAGSVLAVLSQALVDFPLHLPTHSLLLWVNVGLIVSLISAERRSRPERHCLNVPALVMATLLATGLVAAAALPLLAEAASRKALAAHRAGDDGTAVDAARHATSLAPYEHTYWVLLAETLLSSGEPPEADTRPGLMSLEAYREALARRPHHAPTYGRIGAIFLAQSTRVPGAVDSARFYIARSLELNPYHPDPHTNMGTLLQMEGRIAHARKEFLRAAELDERSPIPLFNLGNLEASLDRSREAIELYRQALERDPRHLPSLVNVSSVLVDVGEYEEASALLARAEAISRPGSEIAAAIEKLRAAARSPESRVSESNPTGTSP